MIYYYFKRMIAKNNKLLDLMLRNTSPKMMDKIAKKRAMEIFNESVEKIPAYKKFVGNRAIGSFKDVPSMDKDNYITRFPLKSRCMGGDLSDVRWFDTSSGYSGNLTLWPKGYEETLADEEHIARFVSFMYGIDDKYLVINTFSLGTWIAGLHTANAARQVSCVISPGLRLEEAKKEIQLLSSSFDKLLLLGYPPIVKLLVDSLNNEKFVWPKETMMILSGEGFPEEFREHLFKTTGAKIYSLYASADVGLRKAVETDDTIRLRKLLLKDKQKSISLFGRDIQPMIFQYDPTSVYLENNEKGELLFTALSDKIHPIIKYNLHDIGGLLEPKDIEEKVPGFKFKYQLPIVYLLGRGDGTIIVAGVNIYPDNVKSALFDLNYGKNFTGKLFLEKKYDRKSIPYPKIHIGLKKMAKMDEEKLTEAIRNKNSEYSEAITMKIAKKPEYKFYAGDNFPFKSKSHIKERYV